MGARGVDPRMAEEAMIAAGVQPVEPFPGSELPWMCRCLSCGQDASPRYNSIKRGQGGCKPCGYRKVSKSLTMTSNEAVLRLGALGLVPLAEYPGAHSGWSVECLACGENFKIKLAEKERRGRGRSRCAYATGSSWRRRSPEGAEKILREAGFIPLEGYRGNGHPWRCTHVTCGKETTKRLGDIHMGHKGCVHCSKNGFNFSGPATLYVLEHGELGAVKIGITGVGSERIRKFELIGWRKVHLYQFEVGRKAYEVEQLALSEVRSSKSLDPFLTIGDMAGLGGHSETFDRKSLSPQEMAQIIESKIGKVEENDH